MFNLAGDFERSLSIIFQGPINTGVGAGNTFECIAATRKAYPHSEIIISTWAYDLNISPLVDHYVINTDPGILKYAENQKSFLANVNRQIVSTKNGLEKATRSYAIKIRTDSFLIRKNISAYFKEDKKQKHAFFKSRIIIPRAGTINPVKLPAVYMVSDFFQLGKTEDLLSFWNCALCPSNFSNWHAKLNWKNGHSPDIFDKFSPEQYLWISFLRRKNININLNSLFSASINHFFQSELLFFSNFSSISSKSLGLVLPSRLAKLEDGGIMFRSDSFLLNYLQFVPGGVIIYTVLRIPLFYSACFREIIRFLVRSRFKRL